MALSDDSLLAQRGRVVLVTGGSRGVGRGIAERFLAAGASVVICGRHEPESLPSADGATAAFVATDVRDADQVRALVDGIVAEHGRLDVVVNNAGGAPPAESATAPARFSTAIITLNLLAPLYVAQAANAVMQAQDDGGLVINIGSISASRPNPSAVAYGAAKAGLVNLTETLAVEWAPKVRVNLVAAGYVRTEQSHLYYGDEAGIAAVGATIPLGRMAEPGDIGDACLLLASPLARYITGANLAVHGGGERPAYLDASQGDVAKEKG
ncbi:MAG TPA: SDR family oxidoreductase [Acidimicrobiales bacterium]|nr:SDR family oxidoreductase [Acidimicrobiales bacterium]